MLALAIAACGRTLPEPVPIPAPSERADRLQRRSAPAEPQLIIFDWSYRGRDGRFSGEGGLRFNPPDSVRLDLIEPGGSGVQSAVLIGDRLRYIGERRITLPPAPFVWATLGVFRPPAGMEPQGAWRGEWTQLTYALSPDTGVVFLFDAAGRLVEAEYTVKGDAVQRIRLTVAQQEEESTSSGWVWPREARFRDLSEFHEVRVRVTETRPHAPFEPEIFRVALR